MRFIGNVQLLLRTRIHARDDCGASVARGERAGHVCDEKRRTQYELFHLVQSEVAGFEDELASYLSTPEGRFHTWYAERDRRRAA
jgi:hypothetical protein